MSIYSIWSWILDHLSNLLSCGAILVSLWVWFKQGRYEAQLAKIQLARFNKIELFPELVRSDNNKSSGFRLTNKGDIDAYNVEIEYGPEFPIRGGEYTFPLKVLSPNTPITLLFQPTLASPRSFNIVLKWEDANKRKFSVKKTLYINW